MVSDCFRDFFNGSDFYQFCSVVLVVSHFRESLERWFIHFLSQQSMYVLVFQSQPSFDIIPPLLSLISVPAAVTNLKVTESTTGRLSFNWTASQGELDKYDIFLYNPDKSLQDRVSGEQILQQYSFQNLVQGRLYKMVIVTHSGDLTNETSILGRTGNGLMCQHQEGF